MTDIIGPVMRFLIYGGIILIIVIVLQSVIQWVIGTSEIIKQQKEIITLLQKQADVQDANEKT